ncbi:hypothetical protein CDAR_374861 [Caerostris darwini]|uniref:Uncharacterized protein n=1 Tax=Caerostris darwini TaxID=1538125 RepID=A0AAV4RMY1_9ARAC|nr:hypothetical protein CDAR_374861 [Caerostris darwini]
MLKKRADLPLGSVLWDFQHKTCQSGNIPLGERRSPIGIRFMGFSTQTCHPQNACRGEIGGWPVDRHSSGWVTHVTECVREKSYIDIVRMAE